MAQPHKTLTVIGATGIQGSSVVQAALEAGEKWKVRAITRNGLGEAATALRGGGVEVVTADLNDIRSLKQAFAGSQAIFALTDFFVPFLAFGAVTEKAEELEWKQACNIIEAASSCVTLEHFIWSTLPNASKISQGKYRIPHFLAKNRAEEHIKAIPALLAKTSFLWVAWYATNFQYPIFKPTLLESSGKYVQLAPAPSDIPIWSIGDPKANIGRFVLAALEQPQKTLPGCYILGAVERTSFGQLLSDWSEITDKTAVYVQTTLESYEHLWPGWGFVEGVMLQFYSEFGETSWTTDDVLLTASDLNIQEGELVGVKEAIRKMQLNAED